MPLKTAIEEPVTKWESFLKEHYQSGKKKVPNPNYKTKDKYPEVTIFTAVKTPAFMQKLIEEYRKWAKELKEKEAPQTKKPALTPGSKVNITKAIDAFEGNKSFELKAGEPLELVSYVPGDLEVQVKHKGDTLNVFKSDIEDLFSEPETITAESGKKPELKPGVVIKTSKKIEADDENGESIEIPKGSEIKFLDTYPWGTHKFKYENKTVHLEDDAIDKLFEPEPTKEPKKLEPHQNYKVKESVYVISSSEGDWMTLDKGSDATFLKYDPFENYYLFREHENGAIVKLILEQVLKAFGIEVEKPKKEDKTLKKGVKFNLPEEIEVEAFNGSHIKLPKGTELEYRDKTYGGDYIFLKDNHKIVYLTQYQILKAFGIEVEKPNTDDLGESKKPDKPKKLPKAGTEFTLSEKVKGFHWGQQKEQTVHSGDKLTFKGKVGDAYQFNYKGDQIDFLEAEAEKIFAGKKTPKKKIPKDQKAKKEQGAVITLSKDLTGTYASGTSVSLAAGSKIIFDGMKSGDYVFKKPNGIKQIYVKADQVEDYFEKEPEDKPEIKKGVKIKLTGDIEGETVYSAKPVHLNKGDELELLEGSATSFWLIFKNPKDPSPSENIYVKPLKVMDYFKDFDLPKTETSEPETTAAPKVPFKKGSKIKLTKDLTGENLDNSPVTFKKGTELEFRYGELTGPWLVFKDPNGGPSNNIFLRPDDVKEYFDIEPKKQEPKIGTEITVSELVIDAYGSDVPVGTKLVFKGLAWENTYRFLNSQGDNVYLSKDQIGKYFTPELTKAAPKTPESKQTVGTTIQVSTEIKFWNTEGKPVYMEPGNKIKFLGSSTDEHKFKFKTLDTKEILYLTSDQAKEFFNQVHPSDMTPIKPPQEPGVQIYLKEDLKAKNYWDEKDTKLSKGMGLKFVSVATDGRLVFYSSEIDDKVYLDPDSVKDYFKTYSKPLPVQGATVKLTEDIPAHVTSGGALKEALTIKAGEQLDFTYIANDGKYKFKYGNKDVKIDPETAKKLFRRYRPTAALESSMKAEFLPTNKTAWAKFSDLFDNSHLTSAQKGSIQAYTGSSSEAFNSNLRNGGLGGYNESSIERLDEALRKSTVPHDVKVVRIFGNSNPIGKAMNNKTLMPGSTYTDLGYQSTSVNEDWGKHSGKFRVMINVPKGTHALYVDKKSDGTYLTSVPHAEEYELLIPRGRTVRILSVDYDNKTVECDLLDEEEA